MSRDLLSPATNAEIERAEAALLGMAESEFRPVECPLEHKFSDRTYCRIVTMPAEPGKPLLVIGHTHLHRHLNFVLSGEALVSIDGDIREIKAGDVFESEAGVRKMLVVKSTMRFATVHVNEDNETDIPTLEERYVKKSDSYLTHHAEALLARAASAPALKEPLPAASPSATGCTVCLD